MDSKKKKDQEPSALDLFQHQLLGGAMTPARFQSDSTNKEEAEKLAKLRALQNLGK